MSKGTMTRHLGAAASALLFGLAMTACGGGETGDGGGDESCTPGLPGECPVGFECGLVDPINVVFGCLPASTADSGTPDTGTPDSGTPDAGTPDTGTPDSGTTADVPQEATPDPETACDDGVDNDDDGATDCSDSDCLGTAACPTVETSCDDGVDNDRDNAVDCADSDCANSPVCPESNCGDRIDNNGNGTVDCADPTCDGVLPCGVEDDPTTCNDGIDNDNDGAADCDDDACAALDICIVDYDGWIAYQAPSPNGSLPTVFLVAADGSEGPFQLESGTHVAERPVFSPDGTRLAYSYANTEGERIRVVDLTVGEVADYAFTSLRSVSQPSWSPDGTQIAVVGRITAGEGPSDVFIINLADDSLIGPLTSAADGRFVGSPLFSADGEQIYFIEGIPGQVESGVTADIWVMNADGSDERQITTDQSVFGRIQINSNGTQIVYRRFETGIRMLNTADETVDVINAGSTAQGPTFYGRTNRLIASEPISVGGRDVSDIVILAAGSGARQGKVTDTPNVSEGAPSASPQAAVDLSVVLP
jgi:hypothetical protein